MATNGRHRARREIRQLEALWRMGSSTSERRRAGRLVALSAAAALVIAASALTIPTPDAVRDVGPRAFDPRPSTGERPTPVVARFGRTDRRRRRRPSPISRKDLRAVRRTPPPVWCPIAVRAGGPEHHPGVRGGGASLLHRDPRVLGQGCRGDRVRPRALDGGRDRLGLGGDHRRRRDRVHGCRPRSGGDVLLPGARHPGGRSLGASLRRRVGDDAGGSPGGDGPAGDVEVPDHDRSRLERRRGREQLPDRAVGRRGDRVGGDRDHRTGRHRVQRCRSRAAHDVLLSGRRGERGWVCRRRRTSSPRRRGTGRDRRRDRRRRRPAMGSRAGRR